GLPLNRTARRGSRCFPRWGVKGTGLEPALSARFSLTLSLSLHFTWYFSVVVAHKKTRNRKRRMLARQRRHAVEDSVSVVRIASACDFASFFFVGQAFQPDVSHKTSGWKA